jgi:hypothetical protein
MLSGDFTLTVRAMRKEGKITRKAPLLTKETLYKRRDHADEREKPKVAFSECFHNQLGALEYNPIGSSGYVDG